MPGAVLGTATVGGGGMGPVPGLCHLVPNCALAVPARVGAGWALGAWWGQGVEGQWQPPAEASTRAPHTPAPLPRGTRQPGLCPRPFVWQSAPRASGSARPAPGVPQSHGLEPLRGSGCGPAASGKDVVGIANGQQPPEPAALAGVPQPRQQRGQEGGQQALPPGTTGQPPPAAPG